MTYLWPQVGFYDDGEQGDNGWEAEGFVLTANRVPQSFAVYAIEIGADAKVTKIDLDDANRGSLNVSRLEDLGRACDCGGGDGPRRN